MKLIKRAASAALLMLCWDSPASAQLPWETPQLLAPHTPAGVGVLLASHAAAPGDGWGALLTLRKHDAPAGLGFRFAAGEGRGGRRALAAGVEASAWVARASESFPVDMIWMTGFGGSYGSSAQLALPVGMSAGRQFAGETVWFSPYAAARAILEGRFGGRAPESELDLQLATEVGANVSFDRNRRLIMRMAAAIGDRSALVIGAQFGHKRDAALTVRARPSDAGAESSARRNP